MEAKKEPGKPGLTSSSRELHLRLASEPGIHGHTKFVRWLAPEKAASIQGLSPWRSQIFGLISTTHAACTNRTQPNLRSST